MDHCLLTPEYLKLRTKPAPSFHVSTFLVFDWVLKNLSYSWCGLNRVCRSTLLICVRQIKFKFCRSTLLICVWQIKFFITKQFQYCWIAFSLKKIGKSMCYKIYSPYSLEWNPDTIRRMPLVVKPSLRGCWARRRSWKLTGTTVRV